MKFTLHCFLMALIGVAVAGCHTTEGHFARIVNEHSSVPEPVRESFGVMGVLPATTAAKFNFKHPAGVGDAAVTVGADSYDAMSKWVLNDEDASGREKMAGLAFSAVMSGVAGIVGGIFTGVPEGDLRRAEKEIQQALNEQPLEPGIGSHLKEIVAIIPHTNWVAISESAVARLTDTEIGNGDFRALTNSGINSVLILRVVEEGFSTKRTLNPVMAVDIKLGIQVVRVSDGQTLFRDSLQYRGERRQFTRWAANKAKLFRAELETAQATFAGAVYYELAGDETTAP